MHHPRVVPMAMACLNEMFALLCLVRECFVPSTFLVAALRLPLPVWVGGLFGFGFGTFYLYFGSKPKQS